MFEEMLKLGISLDLWSFDTLIHCFFRLGKPDQAYRMFHDIILNGFHLHSTIKTNVMVTFGSATLITPVAAPNT